MSEANQFSSWSKMLGSIQGRPVALKLPIQKATVRWLLAWRPDTLAARVAAGHAGCSRGGRTRWLLAWRPDTLAAHRDGCGHPGLLAGQRGGAAAGV
jgi:hypothetical protein